MKFSIATVSITAYHTYLPTYLLFLLLSVGPAESHLAHCGLSRLIVLNPALVPLFISRGAPHQTA
jgi:hypothetical protein